jgi:MFS family permease
MLAQPSVVATVVCPQRVRALASPAVPAAFRRLWAAYAASTFGTWIAFDAFPLIAIVVLHAGPAAVSALAAAGLAAGAALAVPLGPWVERRRKRRVMVAMDLLRCGVLLTVPAAYALGCLTFAQLLVVTTIVAAADIAFRAASGAYLKALLASDQLLAANASLEATTWTATALGPPLGGAAIGVLGPMTTVLANAASFVASALGLATIADDEALTRVPRPGAGDVLEGWRTIVGDAFLRALFVNSTLVGALILATAPLMAVLMLGELGFSPAQYALAFGAPCVGGLLGARLSPRLVGRFGRDGVLRWAGTLRACWSIGLAFVGAGAGGLVLVLAFQLGLVTCMGVFNPVSATERLRATPPDRVARVLAAWTVTGRATTALLTALWGALAAAIGPRAAVAAAGVLLLATPLTLPRRAPAASR